MSNEKKPPKGPVFLGITPTGGDPGSLEQAKKAVAERVEARNAGRAPGPDILAAQGMFDPKRDGAMTMSQMGQAQKAFEETPERERPTQISPETAQALQAVRAQADQERAAQPLFAPQPPTPPAPSAAPMPQAPVPPTTQPVAAAPKTPRSAAEGPDDLEFDRLLSLGMTNQQDAINNDAERRAVEERLKDRPINILDAILDGELTQLVPIIPGKLEVVYRVVTPEEDHAIRLHIFEVTSKQGRLESIASELYTLLVLTASVERINGSEMPPHVKRDTVSYALTVDIDVLVRKSQYFLSRPMPLVHTLSTHGFWFEQRARKAFATAQKEDVLGNG